MSESSIMLRFVDPYLMHLLAPGNQKSICKVKIHTLIYNIAYIYKLEALSNVSTWMFQPCIWIFYSMQSITYKVWPTTRRSQRLRHPLHRESVSLSRFIVILRKKKKEKNASTEPHILSCACLILLLGSHVFPLAPSGLAVFGIRATLSAAASYATANADFVFCVRSTVLLTIRLKAELLD